MNGAQLKAAAVVGKIELTDEQKIVQTFRDVSPSILTDEQYYLYNVFANFCMSFEAAVREHHQFETIWCLHTTDFTVSYEGAPTTVYYDGGWGTPQEVKLPENPTVLDVWAACDKAIRDSGDLHHVFIEILDNVNGVLRLQTGS